MERTGTIEIVRQYNLLRIPPLDPDVIGIVWRWLTYRYIPYSHGKVRLEPEDVPMYRTIDIEGHLATFVAAGCLEELQMLFERMGYKTRVTDRVVPSEKLKQKMIVNPERFNKIFKAREWQLELLEVFNNCRNGQIQSATGSGKSTAIRALIYGLPKARILYTTKRIAAVTQQYNELLPIVPEVKLIKSGSRGSDARVVCCTVGKLAAVFDRVFDIVIVDEQHSCCTPLMMRNILPIKCHKIFAFSAQYKDRIDGADRWSDIAFGPLRLSRSYQENVAAKDVVPVEVRWRDTSHFEKLNFDNGFMREHYGIVTNEERNDMIVEDARRHPSEQVLILVRHTEHALILARKLQCIAIYGNLSQEREGELRALRLIRSSEKAITKDEVDAAKKMFSKGVLRLAVATLIWGEAVDFPSLRVVIRGDAQSSNIQTTQIAGRGSRVVEGKVNAIIYDYNDKHESKLANKADERRRNYKNLGYTQVKYVP